MTRTVKHAVQHKKGFALLMAMLMTSVLLAIGFSMLNITLKQYLFSGIGRESEISFYAADAGMECALYWDSATNNRFAIGASASTINCMGVATPAPGGGSSGSTQQFQVEWGTGQTICAKVGVTKYNTSAVGGTIMSNGQTCPQNATCTIIESRGYNASCSALSGPRVVERALRAYY